MFKITLLTIMVLFLPLTKAFSSSCSITSTKGMLKSSCNGSELSITNSNDGFSRVSLFLKSKIRLNLLLDISREEDFSLVHFSFDQNAKGTDYLSEANLGDIKKISHFLKTQSLSKSEKEIASRALAFFKELPRGESLTPLEKSSTAAFNDKSIKTGSWRMICHRIGKRSTGYYRVNGKRYKRRVRVGVKRNGCYGRCGRGCGYRDQYTQECLNHDICASVTNQNLGVCSDEFWAASSGYLSARDCRKK